MCGARDRAIFTCDATKQHFLRARALKLLSGCVVCASILPQFTMIMLQPVEYHPALYALSFIGLWNLLSCILTRLPAQFQASGVGGS